MPASGRTTRPAKKHHTFTRKHYMYITTPLCRRPPLRDIGHSLSLENSGELRRRSEYTADVPDTPPHSTPHTSLLDVNCQRGGVTSTNLCTRLCSTLYVKCQRRGATPTPPQAVNYVFLCSFYI